MLFSEVYYFEVATAGNQRGSHQTRWLCHVDRVRNLARQAVWVVYLRWAWPVHLPGVSFNRKGGNPISGTMDGVHRSLSKMSLW